MTDEHDYWADVEDALRTLHDCAKHVIAGWVDDEDGFAKDVMDLSKASYEAGYLDAIEDVNKAVRKVESDFEA